MKIFKKLFENMTGNQIDYDEEFLKDYADYLRYGSNYKKIRQWNQEIKEIVDNE